MRVLVTGATGFLGRHVLPVLAERHKVVAMARRPVEGFETVVADLTDEFELPAGLDAVVHLAQSRRYREWPEGAADMYAVNVHATFRLLARAGAGRFVYASTGGIYAPSPAPLREDDPVAPSGFYPRSKLAAEVLGTFVLAYGQSPAARTDCVHGCLYSGLPGTRGHAPAGSGRACG